MQHRGFDGLGGQRRRLRRRFVAGGSCQCHRRHLAHDGRGQDASSAHLRHGQRRVRVPPPLRGRGPRAPRHGRRRGEGEPRAAPRADEGGRAAGLLLLDSPAALDRLWLRTLGPHGCRRRCPRDRRGLCAGACSGRAAAGGGLPGGADRIRVHGSAGFETWQPCIGRKTPKRLGIPPRIASCNGTRPASDSPAAAAAASDPARPTSGACAVASATPRPRAPRGAAARRQRQRPRRRRRTVRR
mmetsp:Transcript_173206/g.549897  ORF Transcript_173206/g.549897 Transcript_173206/m.549897 type:complete len:242 (+) Transcript_173206:323-1048(+)